MNRLFRRVATGKLVENVGLYIQTVIMGFSTVLKLLAPLSNIVQCCSNNEHVGWGGGAGEIRGGVNSLRAVNMDGRDEG